MANEVKKSTAPKDEPLKINGSFDNVLNLALGKPVKKEKPKGEKKKKEED